MISLPRTVWANREKYCAMDKNNNKNKDAEHIKRKSVGSIKYSPGGKAKQPDEEYAANGRRTR